MKNWRWRCNTEPGWLCWAPGSCMCLACFSSYGNWCLTMNYILGTSDLEQRGTMATRVCNSDCPHPPTLPFTSMAVCKVRTLCKDSLLTSEIKSAMTLLVTLDWTDSTWRKDVVLQPKKMNIWEEVLQTMTNPIVTGTMQTFYAS